MDETSPLLGVNGDTTVKIDNVEDQRALYVALSKLKAEVKNVEMLLQGKKGRRKRKPNPFFKPWLINNVLTVTIVWQVLNVIALEIFGRVPKWKNDLAVAIWVLVFFQMLFILVLSVKLVKQVLHQTVSMWFIIQSFLSSVFLYGGIYTLIWKFDNSAFTGIKSETTNPDVNNAFVYIQFLAYSMALLTNGASTISLYPDRWYVQLVAASECLLMLVFWTVILSHGTRLFLDPDSSFIEHDRDEEVEEDEEVSG